MTTSLFETGRIVATPGALELADKGINLHTYLTRHIKGDWSEMSIEDQEENRFSIEHGFRIFSAYETPWGRLWIITEADRSVSTLLLPEEY